MSYVIFDPTQNEGVVIGNSKELDPTFEHFTQRESLKWDQLLLLRTKFLNTMKTEKIAVFFLNPYGVQVCKFHPDSGWARSDRCIKMQGYDSTGYLTKRDRNKRWVAFRVI